jgi:hypothetical protein
VDKIIDTDGSGAPRAEANIKVALAQGRIAANEVPRWRAHFARAGYAQATEDLLSRQANPDAPRLSPAAAFSEAAYHTYALATGVRRPDDRRYVPERLGDVPCAGDQVLDAVPKLAGLVSRVTSDVCKAKEDGLARKNNLPLVEAKKHRVHRWSEVNAPAGSGSRPHTAGLFRQTLLARHLEQPLALKRAADLAV